MNVAEVLRQSGRNHQTVRVAKGFSVEAFAVLSGIDEAVILAIEDGNFDFPMSVIFDLATTMNVDFRQILVDSTTFRNI